MACHELGVARHSLSFLRSRRRWLLAVAVTVITLFLNVVACFFLSRCRDSVLDFLICGGHAAKILGYVPWDLVKSIYPFNIL